MMHDLGDSGSVMMNGSPHEGPASRIRSVEAWFVIAIAAHTTTRDNP